MSEFEVYVHVPFCLRRCGYCDFNTYTATDLGGGASRGNYAQMVIEEMQLVYTWQEQHAVVLQPASTVFFGGGTPTVLAADDLIAILHEIDKLWGIKPSAEITTEANPDTVDERYIEQLAHAGFTRISFGMQSAVPHVLQTLDRTHTPQNVIDGVHAAQHCGLRTSVDLIYGAPGETLEDWKYSVHSALDLDIQHLSAYALTIEPHTKMGRQIAAGILPEPDDDDEATKYEIVNAACEQAGMPWYEISNWATPGHESKHNLGYWRNVNWAGFGPGAHSHFRLPSQSDPDQLLSLRAWDIAHPRIWGNHIHAHKVPWQGSETIHPQEHLEESIMLGLRLREGLDVDSIEQRTGLSLQTVIEELQAEGLAEMSQGRLIATLRGRLLNDNIIQRLFNVVL